MLNKVLPDYLRDREADRVAGALQAGAAEVAGSLAAATASVAELQDTDQVARVLAEVAESFLNFEVVAVREMEQRAALAVAPDVLATVPFFETDIYDLAGLLRLGEQIWG